MNDTQRRVMDFWRQEFTNGVFPGTGGLRLQYARQAANGRTTLVVVSGRTEFMEKYAEIFHDLREVGVDFYIYDHRGQGNSARLLDDPQKGHVDKFTHYVKDLEIFLESVVRPERPRKIVLLSHSMGGAISLLLARNHPALLDGLILSSPMFSIDTRPFPRLLARSFARAAILAGMEADYVFGTGPWKRDVPFGNNILTGSRCRFDWNQRLVGERPALAIGGPTFGWLDQSFQALDVLQKKQGPENLPVLLLQGEDDRVVGYREQLEVYRGLGVSRRRSFPHARHELLMEDDMIRSAVLQEIAGFLSGF
jgi:lysophospholipase